VILKEFLLMMNYAAQLVVGVIIQQHSVNIQLEEGIIFGKCMTT